MKTLVLLLILLAACTPVATSSATSSPATLPVVVDTASSVPTFVATDTPAISPTNSPVTVTPNVLTRTATSDGMALVFVPAGEFLMGSSDADTDASPNERPQHIVYLDSFWIDQTDVTNGMYAKCVQAKSCALPGNIYTSVHGLYFGNPEFSNYPVIYVSWDDAQAYCKWAGRRMPTEAEWEKAARGTDARIYPWGNATPTCDLANFGGLTDGCANGDTTAVDAHPKGASPYGVLDMVGNLWQWVADRYGPNYYQTSPRKNPTGPASGTTRALRGGTRVFVATGIRAAIRYYFDPSAGLRDSGIRCATTDLP